MPPPYVRVLGTVQDGGLPHGACSCVRCNAARSIPERKRHVASLAVVLPEVEQVYLIDATPDLHPQLDQLADVRKPPEGRVDRSPLSGIFLTHAHIGHYLGLAHLGFEEIHTQGLPVFATERMAAFLRGNAPWSQLVELGNVALHPLRPGSSVALPQGVKVTPLRVPHRDELSDTVGFFIEGPRRKMLYVPDTDRWELWNPSLTQSLEGVDVALLDGTFYSMEELPGRDISAVPHPLITQTMDRLQGRVQSGALEVFFTHLNHSNPALQPESAAHHAISERGFFILEEGQTLPL